jgi:hypothetical protein
MSDFHDDTYHQSPEANMLIRQMAQEKKWSDECQARAESLIASLTPEDSKAELFTFVEMYTWGLKHWKKRPKPPEPPEPKRRRA